MVDGSSNVTPQREVAQGSQDQPAPSAPLEFAAELDAAAALTAHANQAPPTPAHAAPQRPERAGDKDDNGGLISEEELESLGLRLTSRRVLVDETGDGGQTLTTAGKNATNTVFPLFKLPTEILFGVMDYYLHPSDLRSLAQTNQELRHLVFETKAHSERYNKAQQAYVSYNKILDRRYNKLPDNSRVEFHRKIEDINPRILSEVLNELGSHLQYLRLDIAQIKEPHLFPPLALHLAKFLPACEEDLLAVHAKIVGLSDLSDFFPEELFWLGSGFGAAAEVCGAGLALLGAEVVRTNSPFAAGGGLGQFGADELSGLAANLAKRLDLPACEAGLLAFHAEICRRSSSDPIRIGLFGREDLSNLVGAFGLLIRHAEETRGSRDDLFGLKGLRILHTEILRRGDLSRFTPPQLCDLGSGFGADGGTCGVGLALLGAELEARGGDRRIEDNGFMPRHFAVLATHLAKRPDLPGCRGGLRAIHAEIVRRGDLSVFKAQELSNLVSGFGADSEACGEGLALLVAELHARGQLSPQSDRPLVVDR